MEAATGRARRFQWRPRAPLAAVWVIAITSAFLLAGGIAAQVVDEPSGRSIVEALASAAVVAAFPAVGVLIVLRRPGHAVGWLFCGGGVLLATNVLADAYARSATEGDRITHAGAVAKWVTTVTWAPVLLLIGTLLVLVFPTGAFLSQRWRRLALVGVAGAVANSFGVSLAPGRLPESTVVNPFGIAGWSWLAAVSTVGFVALAVSIVSAFASLVLRYRSSLADDRMRLKWFVFGAGCAAFVLVAYDLLAVGGSTFAAVVSGMGVALIPVCTAVAILRHRLFDIDVLIRKTAVYAAVSVVIGGACVAVTAALGIAAATRLPIVGVVVLTVVATRLVERGRRGLQRVVSHTILGRRPSRYELLTEFGETLEHAFEVHDLAQRAAIMVRDGIGLAWVAIIAHFKTGDAGLDERLAAAGLESDDAPEPERVIPLIHAGEPVGSMELGPKNDGHLSPADEELLATIARQTALALHNARLAAELASRLDEIRRQADELISSRARIVSAQDAERRRIERNIHDGVQQQIVALHSVVALARSQLARDPHKADETLIELQGHITQTVKELRELAHGIHPAVLADRGLLEAIEAGAGRMPIAVHIDAPPSMRGLRCPEDIEAAAYYVVAEALANVLKHAAARAVTIKLGLVGTELRVEIRDDGSGFAVESMRSSGLVGLRDRVEALGGRFTIVSTPGSGTRLICHFPGAVAETAT
jgi:signal transduction histidine kinase